MVSPAQSRRNGSTKRAATARTRSKQLQAHARELRVSALTAVERGRRMLGDYLIRKNRLVIADRREN
jgi:hypothetical protein